MLALIDKKINKGATGKSKINVREVSAAIFHFFKNNVCGMFMLSYAAICFCLLKTVTEKIKKFRL